MEEKIAIIKQIVQFHPSMGSNMGYGWYVGGMRDSGGWCWEKMVDEDTHTLRDFLNDLIYKTKEAKAKQEIENNKSYREKVQEILDRNKNNPYILDTLMRMLNEGKEDTVFTFE